MIYLSVDGKKKTKNKTKQGKTAFRDVSLLSGHEGLSESLSFREYDFVSLYWQNVVFSVVILKILSICLYRSRMCYFPTAKENCYIRSKCDNIAQNLLVFSEKKCVLSFTPLKLLLILNLSTGVACRPVDAVKVEQLYGMEWRKRGS